MESFIKDSPEYTLTCSQLRLSAFDLTPYPTTTFLLWPPVELHGAVRILTNLHRYHIRGVGEEQPAIIFSI